jgi:Ca2+-binding RTX toxin-like protein
MSPNGGAGSDVVDANGSGDLVLGGSGCDTLINTGNGTTFLSGASNDTLVESGGANNTPRRRQWRQHRELGRRGGRCDREFGNRHGDQRRGRHRYAAQHRGRNRLRLQRYADRLTGDDVLADGAGMTRSSAAAAETR